MTDDCDTDSQPVVVFLSGDLMFASRIKSAAQAVGCGFRMGGSVPNCPNIRLVIVDLATRFGAVASLMESCRQHCPDARVVAFGPHVQTDRLDQARQAGIPIVLTRGKFDRDLVTLLEA